MQKLSIRAVATIAAMSLLAVGVTAAFAASPHFLKATASVDAAGNLQCTFKEAGLGNTLTTADISCSANATAVYACINRGGNHPQAANKETINTVVGASETFPVRNGSTSGTITVLVPGPGDFSCPGGQKRVLASVSYSDVTLSGAGATAKATPNPASRTFLDI